MEHPENSVSYSEKLFGRFISLCRNHRYPIVSSLIFGFLAHMFTFTNKLVNHDDVFALFSKNATFESGRWGLKLMSSIFPDFSMPWIYGVISILLITAGICLILHTLSIRSKLLQVLTAGLIISFPALTGTFSFMFTSSSYAVSFVLAAFAAYFLCRNTKRGFLPALICMILSVSIYQAYIAVTASVLILFLIRRVLQEEGMEKAILLQGVVFVAFLGISLGLYWLLTKLIWAATGTELGSYASSALTSDSSGILRRVLYAYLYFFRTIFSSSYGFVRNGLMQIIHCICILLICFVILFWAIKTRKWLRILLLLALLAVFPLGVNSMFLFTSVSSIHTLVLYSFSMVYVLAALVIEIGCQIMSDKKCLKICKEITFDLAALGMAIVLLCNTYAANEAYLHMHLRYENTYATCTTLISQIRMTPGYTDDTQVALMGFYSEPEYYTEEFPDLSQFSGVRCLSVNYYSKWQFFYYYCGTQLNLADEAIMHDIAASEAYQYMPCYPDYGSVAMLDDVLVVKFS